MGRIPMDDPMFDEHGYPMRETLDEIALWQKKRGWRELMRFVNKAWKQWDDRRIEGGSLVSGTLVDGREVWLAAPGGWTGNEDIIAALRENNAFWEECCLWAMGVPSLPCAFQLWPPVAPCGDHRYCDTCLNRHDCGYLVEDDND